MTQPLVIPLVTGLGARYNSLTVDAKIVNGFVEQNSFTKEMHVYKRPGFVLRSSLLPAGTPRGLVRWSNQVYAILGTTLYRDGVALVGALSATGGDYTFAAGLGATPRLFFHNEDFGYTVDAAGTITTITDTNFPPNETPAKKLVPGAVYLNGTFYVLTTDGLLVNSSATDNDPLTWEAAFLAAEFEGNEPVALAKNLTYLVVFKDFYTEVFYDAGNPAPDSPLSPVTGAQMNYGLLAARSLVNVGGDLLFISQTNEGGPCVVAISQLSASVISIPQIERILQNADLTSVYAWAARSEGHRFYGFTLPITGVTLVYDLTSGLWYTWTDTVGSYLPYAYSTIDTNNRTVFLHESSGRTYNLSGLTFTDDGALFSCEIYTPNFSRDASTKIIGRLDVVGDRVPGSTVELRWSDDDYATWSVPQSIDLSLDRPGLPDLGSFYRRAFHFKHRAALPFRVEKAVVLIGQGN